MEQSFLEIMPDKKSRISAMTSMVSPDMKALTLFSMEVCVPYTITELYKKVMADTNSNTYTFPLTVTVPFLYCKHSLAPMGAVVKTKEKLGPVPAREKYVAAYEKTKDGALFGDSVATTAIWTVARLSERDGDKTSSMWRIFGTPSKKPENIHAYAVYCLTELLANNPNREYSRIDLAKSLSHEEFSLNSLSNALNALGEAGIISYKSNMKDVDGKFTTGPSTYELSQGAAQIDLQEAQAKMCAFKASRFRTGVIKRNGIIERTVSYINSHADEQFELTKKLATELSTDRVKLVRVFGALADIGYLKTLARGGIKESSAQANHNTSRFWEEFLKPIGLVAETGDPYIAKFREKLEEYKENPNLFQDDIRKLIRTYDKERSFIPQGAGLLRQTIIEAFRTNENPIKLSMLTEQTNSLLGDRKLDSHAIRHQIERNMKDEVERIGRGMYRLKDVKIKAKE